ncbi:hypothetical protein MRX96_049799 [Rhipicephalus microplus]
MLKREFSFEEIGTKDLPAVIDHILNVTNFTKVGLLTTSQGTTASLVLLSMLPEYNKKVNILVGYAPVANVTHFTSPMRLLIPFSKLVKAVNDFFTHGGFLVSNEKRQEEVAKLCDHRFFRNLCYKPLAFLKNVLHYGQMYTKKNFVRFDYGKNNTAIYGQNDPPPYPVVNISVPFAIYQGQGDIFANPQDVHDLAERLRCILVVNETVPDPEFGHLDFIYGNNATGILHNHMLCKRSDFTGGPENYLGDPIYAFGAFCYALKLPTLSEHKRLFDDKGYSVVSSCSFDDVASDASLWFLTVTQSAATTKTVRMPSAMAAKLRARTLQGTSHSSLFPSLCCQNSQRTHLPSLGLPGRSLFPSASRLTRMRGTAAGATAGKTLIAGYAYSASSACSPVGEGITPR